MSELINEQIKNHGNDIRRLFDKAEGCMKDITKLKAQDLSNKIDKLDSEVEDIKMGYEELKGTLALIPNKIEESTNILKNEITKTKKPPPESSGKFDMIYKFRWPLVTVVLSISLLLFLTGDLSTLIQSLLDKN